MFPTPDFLTLRAALLRDIANQLPDAAVGNDSDFAIRANAVAAAIEGLYQHQQWLVRQMLPDTADSDYLERWASLYGISRKPAATASGTMTFTVTANSQIPLGTEAVTPDGLAFVTTAAGSVLAGGQLTLAARAVLAGVSGNIAAATPLTLTAAPAGVNSACGVATAMTGGVDVESDAALLARLLSVMRLPPMGGAAHDYIAWAMQVAGVTDAYVFGQRRAINSVDVVIETAGGMPSAALLAQVAAHIEALRPVTADVVVMPPTPVTVNVAATLTLATTTLAEASVRIGLVLQTYFNGLQLGEAVTQARLIGLLMAVEGVTDVQLTLPAANVIILADATHSELAVLGTVTLA